MSLCHSFGDAVVGNATMRVGCAVDVVVMIIVDTYRRRACGLSVASAPTKNGDNATRIKFQSGHFAVKSNDATTYVDFHCDCSSSRE